MNIDKDRAVQIHYHLTDPDGDVIDTSRDAEPLTYLHGRGDLLPAVEAALVGKTPGDKVTTVILPADGYGVHDPDLDVGVPLEMFPPEAHSQLEPGVMFQGPHPKDPTEMVSFTVIEVLEDAIVASANHPLAGVVLHFDMEVLDVREATEEELAHGHVHGPGGHHHH